MSRRYGRKQLPSKRIGGVKVQVPWLLIGDVRIWRKTKISSYPKAYSNPVKLFDFVKKPNRLVVIGGIETH
jgi:hypothetical protein